MTTGLNIISGQVCDLTTFVVWRQGLAFSTGRNRTDVFYLMTEKDSILQNVVCFNQKQAMDNA
jgi:hypothetical protein